MDDTLKWFAGLVVAAVLAIIEGFRRMSARIAKLHERVDAVKDDYVRRDDLDRRLESLESTLVRENELLRSEVHGVRSDMKEHNRAVLKALGKGS